MNKIMTLCAALLLSCMGAAHVSVTFVASEVPATITLTEDAMFLDEAVAIYGTRGTNGVIITTKRGDNFSDVTNTRVEYSGYASVSVRNGDLGMATPEEFRNLAELSNGAVTPVTYASTDGYAYNTDWKMAVVLNPTTPIYDSTKANGYYQPQGIGLSNPVEQMNQKKSYQDGNYFRGSVKATVNIKPVQGLRLSGFAAMEEGDNYNYGYSANSLKVTLPNLTRFPRVSLRSLFLS